MSVIVVGTRPQFIRLFGLLQAGALPEDIVVVHTGQHYDHEMSRIFEVELDLPISSNLNMKSMEDGIFKLCVFLRKHKTKHVYVMGDCTSSCVGAIAAKTLDIYLTHIEAGLRSTEFIPEEINRRFIDRISNDLWCPTDYAMKNLQHENVKGIIRRSPNYRILTLREILKHIEPNTEYEVVCEFHRQSNVDDIVRLKAIAAVLYGTERKTLWSVHPRIRKHIEPNGTDMLIISKPMGYLEWISHLAGADLIITDSGGIQLEAYELGKIIAVLRSDTEWKHTMNTSYLIGDDLGVLKRMLCSGPEIPST